MLYGAYHNHEDFGETMSCENCYHKDFPENKVLDHNSPTSEESRPDIHSPQGAKPNKTVVDDESPSFGNREVGQGLADTQTQASSEDVKIKTIIENYFDWDLEDDWKDMDCNLGDIVNCCKKAKKQAYAEVFKELDGSLLPNRRVVGFSVLDRYRNIKKKFMGDDVA